MLATRWFGHFAAVVCFAIVVGAFSGGSRAASGGTLVFETASGPHSFNIELATTQQERVLGLMFRPSLPENAGMLFLYDQPQAISMWMKNTLIPLDMIFIDDWGKVHRIETHTEPFSLTPISSDGDVIGVLEVNAGVADAIGLKAGDKVVYPGLSAAPAH